MSPSAPELPTLLFENQQAWADWLEQHGSSSPGAWLQLAKKKSNLLFIEMFSRNEKIHS